MDEKKYFYKKADFERQVRPTLENQLDPQEMIDAMVAIIGNGRPGIAAVPAGRSAYIGSSER